MAKQDRTSLVFEVYRGATLLQTAEFSEESVTIGSGADALLLVEDPSLAALHAVFNVEQDGSVRVLDLGAEAGVVHRGSRVTDAPVNPGDSFTLGDLSVVVRFDAPVSTEDQTVVHAKRPKFDPTEVSTVYMDAEDISELARQELDEPAERDAGEDALSFVLRAGSSSSSAGENRNAPKVLEVSQVWESIILDTRHYRRSGKPVTIGSESGHKWTFIGMDIGWVPAPLASILPFTPPMWSEVNTQYKNEFYTPDHALPGNAAHALLSWKGNQYVANVSSAWGGFALIGDDRYSFEDLVARGKAQKSGAGYEIPMDDEIKLAIQVDETTFVAQLVHQSQKVGPGWMALLGLTLMAEAFFLGLLSLFAFLGLLFALLVMFMPRPPDSDFMKIDERFVDMLLDKQKKEEEKKDKKPQANPDAGEGAKAKREEGKVGKKDAKMEKAKGNKVEMQKAQLDKQIAEDAGLLGALRDSGMMDGMGGAVDAEMLGGIGGLIGAKGVQVGSGGLGSRGSGLGGGGTADGLGGLGTKGMGSGASGYGRGGGNFGEKGEGALGAVGGDPIIIGALDKALIDAVVKRHMNAIRYCYQRELVKSPSLKGKVSIKFTIAKDGSVSAASTKSSTLGSSTAEGCIVNQFLRMKFPEPKGGGIVIVTYPFIFTAGN
jgi:hypothetical protein